MIELLIALSLSPMNPAAKPFTTCQMPNKCAKPVQTAQFQPCVWPNTCAKPVAVKVLAQYQPCVWPNKCSGAVEAVL